MTYYFSETDNFASYRVANALKAKTLTAAKREASRNKYFQGTCLKIGTAIDEDGFIVRSSLLSIKEEGEKWCDIDVDEGWERERRRWQRDCKKKSVFGGYYND